MTPLYFINFKRNDKDIKSKKKVEALVFFSSSRILFKNLNFIKIVLNPFVILGTGKTLLARAVAHHTECTFIRVSGSELVQKFIGEGSRMVRELFVLAR